MIITVVGVILVAVGLSIIAVVCTEGGRKAGYHAGYEEGYREGYEDGVADGKGTEPTSLDLNMVSRGRRNGLTDHDTWTKTRPKS